MKTALVLIGLALFQVENIYEQFFKEANDAYYKSDFLTAVQLYEKLIQSGVEHPVLFYNLGNAYYHFGKKGLAIANYERAIELHPSFTLAKENLKKTLNETKRNLALPEDPLWWRYLFFWHYGINKRMTWLIGISFWVVFWAIIGLYKYMKKENRTWFLYVSAPLFFISLVFLISGIIKQYSHPFAVVIREKIEAKVTPTENSPVRFELYEGDRVVVEKEEGDWSLIQVVNQERGWVKSEDIFIWKPPYRFTNELVKESPTS